MTKSIRDSFQMWYVLNYNEDIKSVKQSFQNETNSDRKEDIVVFIKTYSGTFTIFTKH